MKMGMLTCSVCGIQISVPDHWEQARREDHATFYCANGHGQHFPAKNEVEKLQAALSIKNMALATCEERNAGYRMRLESERRSAAALRGVITKMKKGRK
jgi:hypothetical protein